MVCLVFVFISSVWQIYTMARLLNPSSRLIYLLDWSWLWHDLLRSYRLAKSETITRKGNFNDFCTCTTLHDVYTLEGLQDLVLFITFFELEVGTLHVSIARLLESVLVFASLVQMLVLDFVSIFALTLEWTASDRHLSLCSIILDSPGSKITTVGDCLLMDKHLLVTAILFACVIGFIHSAFFVAHILSLQERKGIPDEKERELEKLVDALSSKLADK